MCEFVTKDVIERAFRNYFKDENLEILQFDAKPAVEVGENYASKMYRVNVKYIRYQMKNEESMSVLIKIQFVDKYMAALTEELNLFGKEMEMFGKTLPLMYEVLGMERDKSLSAPCLLSTEDPVWMIVVQDLKPLGYRMASRQTGLDIDHCKLVLENIAKFHAASAVIVQKDLSVTKTYQTGLYRENKILGPWINKGVNSIIKVCKTWPGMEKYGEKMEKYIEELKKCGKTVGSRGQEVGDMAGFKVITHGDLWTNNLLFQYDNKNKPINIKFVDFQVAYYSSPVLDLHFFFATSISAEVLRKYNGLLLEHYFEHFLKALSAINNNISETLIDWTTFMDDFKKRSFHGILAATTIAPAARADKRDDANFEALLQEEEEGNFRHHCFNNSIYREFMEFYVPYLDSLGAFDF